MLKWPKRFLIVAWYGFIFLVAIGLVVSNESRVSVNLFGFIIDDVQLGVLLCCFFSAGGVIGLLVGWSGTLRYRWKMRKLKKQGLQVVVAQAGPEAPVAAKNVETISSAGESKSLSQSGTAAG